MKLRIDFRPYFPDICAYYWKHIYDLNQGSIWDWMKRDYDMVKIGSIGSKPEMWVTFPDEATLMWFKLKWM